MCKWRLAPTSEKILSNKSIQEVDGGVVFAAKIVPASSKTAVCGLLDGMVKFKVSAPPQKGEANQCNRDGEYHPQEQSTQPSDHLQFSFITHQTDLGIGAPWNTGHSRHSSLISPETSRCTCQQGRPLSKYAGQVSRFPWEHSFVAQQRIWS